MCDNILAYLPCVYSIFTTLELSPDPLYDPDANKSGWELFWKGVAEWFNGLSNEQKIGWGIVALLAACLVAAATSFATGGTSWAMLAAMANVFMEFAVGVISYVALSACMALISGGDVAETISNSTADAIFLGGIFSFVSSGINAVKVGIRSSYNAKLPGSLAVGAQPQSVIYPPNSGFKGKPSKKVLQPGEIIDRYGYDSGYFVSPQGTPFEMRSLPADAISKPYHAYVVQKPVKVLSGEIAPWFGQPGGGIQYKFFKSIKKLIKKGVIREIG